MKRILFSCTLMLACYVLYAQNQWDETFYPGVPLKIGVESNIWDSKIVVLRESNVTKILNRNERVIGGTAFLRIDVDGVICDLAEIKYDGRKYYIYTSNLIPNNGRLPENWITSNNIQRKWIISYYLDVLRSQNRDTFLNYEKQWIEFETSKIEYSISNNEAPLDDKWYDSRIYFESLVFYNAVIIMGGFGRNDFFITDIVSFDTGYKISIIGDRWYASSLDIWHEISLPFPRYTDRQSFDLIFIPDGDYMDAYLDDPGNHFATFAKVDVNVLEELHMLMLNNTVDVSRITFWPRRADGSMDYPPPINMSNYSSTHRTTDKLSLHDNANNSAKIITTLLKDTEVQVIEIDSSIKTGGIITPWAKIISNTGFSGWCLLDDLEEIMDPVVYGVAEGEISVQKNKNNKSLPLPLLFAIIGGVAVITGIVVVVLRKKK